MKKTTLKSKPQEGRLNYGPMAYIPWFPVDGQEFQEEIGTAKLSDKPQKEFGGRSIKEKPFRIDR